MNKNVEEIVKTIYDYFENHRNEANIEHYSRWFKGGFVGFGLDTGDLKALSTQIKKRPDFCVELALDIADKLVSDIRYEAVIVAYSIVSAKAGELDKVAFNRISNWFEVGIENWAHCDVISGEIISPMLINKVIDYSDLENWRISTRKFKRRAAPVSIIKYFKIAKNLEESIAFLEPMILDAERETQQGIGWALREIWKLDNEIVENLLMKYRNDAPRLIYQYACEKMDKEYKKRFARDKKTKK
jgi:3-methyladenine DNA glycosylase AlkD